MRFFQDNLYAKRTAVLEMQIKLDVKTGKQVFDWNKWNVIKCAFLIMWGKRYRSILKYRKKLSILVFRVLAAICSYGFNFTNVFCARFSYECLFLVTFKLEKRRSYEKRAWKTLVKLTPDQSQFE